MKIAGATIIGILTVLALILIAAGVFNQPDVIIAKQTLQSHCPSTIEDFFKLSFTNYGEADAMVHTKVHSSELVFPEPEEQVIVPPTNQEIPLIIEVMTYASGQATIEYEWWYKKFGFLKDGGKGSCTYERDPNNPGRMRLK